MLHGGTRLDVSFTPEDRTAAGRNGDAAKPVWITSVGVPLRVWGRYTAVVHHLSDHRNNCGCSHRAAEASEMGLKGSVMVSSGSMTDEPICLLLQFLFNYSGAKQ